MKASCSTDWLNNSMVSMVSKVRSEVAADDSTSLNIVDAGVVNEKMAEI